MMQMVQVVEMVQVVVVGGEGVVALPQRLVAAAGGVLATPSGRQVVVEVGDPPGQEEVGAPVELVEVH